MNQFINSFGFCQTAGQGPEPANGRKAEYVNINFPFAEQVKNGKNTDMPVWRFVQELNRYNLEAPAVITEDSQYTYGQLFLKWKQYASVFSALGITGANGARACFLYPESPEAIFSFFGLNMVGTPVSLITVLELVNEELLLSSLKKEGITELLLMDYLASPQLLLTLLSRRTELGLRHIIVIRNSLGSNAITPAEQLLFQRNYLQIHAIPGILFMDSLLFFYGAYPIPTPQNTGDQEACIVHTTGTTKGIRKPIPFTDRQLNLAAFRYLRDYPKPETFDYYLRMSLSLDLSTVYGLIPQLLTCLCGGNQLMISYLGLFDLHYHEVIAKYHINCIDTTCVIMDAWEKLPQRPDLACVQWVGLGGTFVSAETRKKYNRFLEQCGSRAKIMVGYGLSEVGGTVTCTEEGVEDDSIGYPAPGILLKLQDENTKEFHDITEGPMVGGLYVHSDTISSGLVHGEKYFDTVQIDGLEYLCTYDLVRVNENGSLTCCGRMNSFFVNNEGIRFQAGLIENELEHEPGICHCIIMPFYDKMIHDTVPLLFVETDDREQQEETVRAALRNVFVKNGTAEKTTLPVQVLFVAGMPVGHSGKVSRYELDCNDTSCRRCDISAVREDGRLTDILLTPVQQVSRIGGSIPDELKQANPLGAFDFGRLFQSPELLKFICPLVVSAVLFGRVISREEIREAVAKLLKQGKPAAAAGEHAGEIHQTGKSAQ